MIKNRKTPKSESRKTPEWRAYNREHYKKNKDKFLEARRISQRARYQKYRELIRAEQAEYYAKNNERIIARNCAYGKKNIRHKITYDKQRQLGKYGLTVEEFDAWSLRLGGLCTICRRAPGGRMKRLAVDHCHKTGAVRGLLCTRCNTGIGAFGDSIEMLEKAIQYLRDVQTKEESAA